jgi:ATP-dependent Lon protease
MCFTGVAISVLEHSPSTLSHGTLTSLSSSTFTRAKEKKKLRSRSLLFSLDPRSFVSSLRLRVFFLSDVSKIPWGRHTPENYSITHAQTVLDEDHYGLTDAKSRILEFLAVGKLRGSVQGKILCLAGPPSVGKTSIGKSISRALGRRFFQI